MFYSWASKKVKATCYSFIIFFVNSIVSPLIYCILTNFSYIIFLLFLTKSRYIYKVYTISLFMMILILYSTSILYFFRSFPYITWIFFSLSLLEATNKSSFSCILTSSDQNVQKFVFYVWYLLFLLLLILSLMTKVWLFIFFISFSWAFLLLL